MYTRTVRIQRRFGSLRVFKNIGNLENPNTVSYNKCSIICREQCKSNFLVKFPVFSKIKSGTTSSWAPSCATFFCGERWHVPVGRSPKNQRPPIVSARWFCCTTKQWKMAGKRGKISVVWQHYANNSKGFWNCGKRSELFEPLMHGDQRGILMRKCTNWYRNFLYTVTGFEIVLE